jgi:integrase
VIWDVTGGGLHLLVQPNGSKLWRLRYRFNGKRTCLPLARSLPPRKLDKIAAATAARNTFGDVAAEHLANLEANGTAATTMKKNRWMLQKLCTPITKRPIAEITAAEILDLLKKVEKSGRRETATSLRGKIGSVFRYGVVTLRATNDPTYALRGALLKV